MYDRYGIKMMTGGEWCACVSCVLGNVWGFIVGRRVNGAHDEL